MPVDGFPAPEPLGKTPDEVGLPDEPKVGLLVMIG